MQQRERPGLQQPNQLLRRTHALNWRARTQREQARGVEVRMSNERQHSQRWWQLGEKPFIRVRIAIIEFFEFK